jgi:hypothetical protein
MFPKLVALGDGFGYGKFVGYLDRDFHLTSLMVFSMGWLYGQVSVAFLETMA